MTELGLDKHINFIASRLGKLSSEMLGSEHRCILITCACC